jgi:GNAT superfamily N-acetyltransferase
MESRREAFIASLPERPMFESVTSDPQRFRQSYSERGDLGANLVNRRTPDTVPAPSHEGVFRTKAGADIVLSRHPDDKGSVVYAWHEGKPVGMMRTSPEDSEALLRGQRERAAMSSPTPSVIGVDEEHQRQGVARAIFRFAQQAQDFPSHPLWGVSHSLFLTDDGQKFARKVPNDPKDDPVRKHPKPRQVRKRLF